MSKSNTNDEEINFYGLTLSDDVNPAATSRMEAEIRLFQERGWQKYILFLADFIKALDCKNDWCFLSKSAMDSFVLAKMVDPEQDLLKMPDQQNAYELLKNGALRLEVTAVGPDLKLLEKPLKKIDSVLKDTLAGHPLTYRQEVITAPSGQGGGLEMIVLSDGEIPEEDFDLIRNACKGSSAEDAAALRKYLIVTIRVKFGI